MRITKLASLATVFSSRVLKGDWFLVSSSLALSKVQTVQS